MPLVLRSVVPVDVSNSPLTLSSKFDSEFIGVNNGTLVNVLRQLASLVSHASDIFINVSVLTRELGDKIRTVKLRLDELEVKTELYDPKLVPVPEGNLEESPIKYSRIHSDEFENGFFSWKSRPKCLAQLYERAGRHEPNIPQRSPILGKSGHQRRALAENSSQRGGSFVSLREWKLDDFVDDKILTLRKRKPLVSEEEVGRVLSKPFPSAVVPVDVTGRGFDRMKSHRRSLIIHTKKIRTKKRRRNTICGTMPNKECGIQTSLGSVTLPTSEGGGGGGRRSRGGKYGIDSGHWSSSGHSSGVLIYTPSSSSTSPSYPPLPNSASDSSSFCFDDEDRSLTPQLENFTDGMVSDSDSVDTEGYFTSFRNECGFPKWKRSANSSSATLKENKEKTGSLESEYELFGKGSTTSTTASSCGTVVLRTRTKPEPPLRISSSAEQIPSNNKSQSDDVGWEERVKRKSLIELVPSLVVLTPPPSSEPHSSESESDKLNSSSSSTETLTPPPPLPQPDVIPAVTPIRTKTGPKLNIRQEYFSLDSLPSPSGEEGEEERSKNRGARVVLDGNGHIIFSSETLRRKKKTKISFEPGPAVKLGLGGEEGYVSIYARTPRESVYDRIRLDESKKEELYEAIEEIRRHNLKDELIINPSYPPLTVCEEGEEEKQIGILETDLDSAIPPVMPELKTLPKIKDRLKRNESYRIATDEIIPPPPQESLKTKLLRLSSSSSNGEAKTNSNLIVSKKRDILEEDPEFIQQVLNSSQQSASKIENPFTRPLTLSKLALSPEDKPSFLRKESPPTMDEITKEIYRFRKKFNIKPNSASTKLCHSPGPFSTHLSPISTNLKSINQNKSTFKNIPPQPPERQFFTKNSSSVPVTPSTKSDENYYFASSSKDKSQTSSLIRPNSIDSNHRGLLLRRLPQLPIFSTPKIFSVLKDKSNSKSPSLLDGKKITHSPCSSSPKSVSFSINEEKLNSSSSPISLSSPGTSLSEFKKLLLAAKKTSGKNNSISAVEILKPKLMGIETTL